MIHTSTNSNEKIKELKKKRQEHKMMLDMIISARVAHEKLGIPVDLDYIKNMAILRKKLRETI